VILVVDYDPAWPEQFAALRDRYAEVLADVHVVAIEHVGSTSVPGLAAKPILDIDIVVASSDVDAACRALEAIGYESLGEMGVPERWAFRAPPSGPRRNTYVTVEGCLSLRNHLGVRDVLRSDPALRDRYGALKRQLGAVHDDVEEYVKGKSVVVQEILARAGLNDHERAQIDAINR
jgi:GrpB-like predicted nucleotidyltransferase (UPF0157 family)